jgi:hypothetical protein
MLDEDLCAKIPVRALLAAKSLAPALRAHIAAADSDGDGSLSPDEVLAVLRSELTLASERRVLRRVAVALAVGLVLAVAAVAGLTVAVVAASKDTASSGGALVDKASGAPLATGAAIGRLDLPGLWQGADDATLAGLTALYATGADGVRRMWRVAGVEVAAGEWARVNASEPGVSFYITAEGVSLEGVPAEQADGGAAGAWRRRLLSEGEPQASCMCGAGECDCSACGECVALECQTATCINKVCELTNKPGGTRCKNMYMCWNGECQAPPSSP